MHTTRKELRPIPIPFGRFIARVSIGCGGRVPDRCTPSALAIELWSLDGIADDDQHVYRLAAQHWTLSAALTCVGDVARHIAMREPLYPRGDA